MTTNNDPTPEQEVRFRELVARLRSSGQTRELLDRLARRQAQTRAILLDLDHASPAHQDAAYITLAVLLLNMQESICAHLTGAPWPVEPVGALQLAAQIREGGE